MEKKLRKYSNTLVVSGTGVLLFGVWSMAKTIMYFALAPVFAEALMEFDPENTFMRTAVMYLVWCLIGFFLAVELIMRTCIGLSAIAEGKGKKKGYWYLLLAGYLVIQHLLFLVQSIGTAQYMTDNILDTIITLILDLTSLYTMLEMMVSSVRVKRCRKALS